MAHGQDTDIALQRIQEWIQQGDSNVLLDFSSLNITSLPPLPDSLQKLYCYKTQITSLPPLPGSLQLLNCSHTKITSLPPLPKSLKCLNCSHTKITSLPPLPTSLKELYCYSSTITYLPSLPASLKKFFCSITQITSLPSLPNSLTDLYCKNCPNLLLQREEGESVQNYESRWKSFREKITRDRCLQCCKAIKEELMAVTWHPDRYLQWCIDEEERSFWKQGEQYSCSNAA